jgi:CRISPR/Cas system-associated exonuclease Cas4 (RecB family)
MHDPQTILEYITEAIPNHRVYFVFPSAVPAQFWARATAESILEPVTPARFIAWDTFKAQSLSVKQREKEVINRAVRTLFASNLLKENAQKGKPFLTDYINPGYAASYSSFISPLSKLLPALEGILRRFEAAGTQEDPYFTDLRRIWERYVGFLDEHHLYEPAWNRTAFTPSEDRWLLFFPELAEDWEEYREELTAIAEQGEDSPIKIIPLEEIAPPGYGNQGATFEIIKTILGACGGRGIQFSYAGEEYRWLALTIRRLLDEGLCCPEDIAISFPGDADLERLIQEFRLHDLPVNPRHGRALTEYPGGRIFAAMAACPGGKWSFQSLKNLLLDKAFPWKDTQLIDALMDFGLRYRCMSGFTEGHQEIDVWERTFDRHLKQDFAGMPVFKIGNFYERLKKDILRLVNAPRFGDLAEAWHQFETRYFDRQAFNPEVDKILARAIKALEELMAIEDRFPDLSGGSDGIGRVFPIFQAYLQEQMYVYQSGPHGIPLYDYKVAAGIGPAVHFIINMNQEAAAVVYTGGASFLQEDRKSLLGIKDRDISGEFIRAYRFSGVFPVFTLSLKTFNGPAIPHRWLSEFLGKPLSGDALRFPGDPYLVEASLADRRTAPSPSSPIYPSEAQRQGWQALQILRKPPFAGDLRASSIMDSGLRAALEERLSEQALFRRAKRAPTIEKEETCYISPTDLNEYILCPFKWVLQRGLLIREKQTEIETIDQRDLGTLYHRILERLFMRIKQEDRCFRGDNFVMYQSYLKEETKATLEEARSREGAFQESIYAMLEQRILAALSDYLKGDLMILDGAEILGAEYPLRKNYAPGEPRLIGFADIVLEDKTEGIILTDFKTGAIPTKKELLAGEKDAPENMQMAAYIAMIENPHAAAQTEEGDDKKRMVTTARFYSIDNREYRRVVSEKEEQERNLIPRTDYDKEVASVDKVFGEVTEAMKQGAYQTPKNHKQKICGKCTVSSVCRIPFIGGEPQRVL